MRTRSFVAISSLLLLGGCAVPGDSIFDESRPPALPPVIDGYGNPAPELQRQEYQGDNQMPMMQDEEGQFEDQGIEVKASNKTEAENVCKDIANYRSDEWTVVTCLGCRMLTKTTGKFICTLRIETVNPPSTQPPEDGNE
jgi:hypothetical protein